MERNSTWNPTFATLETCYVLAEDKKLAIVTRCSTAWGKFKRLLPILTSKHVCLRTRGKVFNACVRSALLHGSETWALSAPDLRRLRRNDRSMVRWICRVRDDDEVSANTLCAMLGVQEVTAALRTRRLRWTCCTLHFMHKLHHKYDDS